MSKKNEAKTLTSTPEPDGEVVTLLRSIDSSLKALAAALPRAQTHVEGMADHRAAVEHAKLAEGNVGRGNA